MNKQDGRSTVLCASVLKNNAARTKVCPTRVFTPENSVKIRARLLKEIVLDITNWTFEDVTPGKRSFRLTTVKGGSKDGEIVLSEILEINGKDLPNKEAGEPVDVSWALADGTLKIATRAGVPGSRLQVFEHACAWDCE